MFRSLSPRRSSSAQRRPAGSRLHLEALEERLPPGDTLGALLGWSWLKNELPLTPPAEPRTAELRQQTEPQPVPAVTLLDSVLPKQQSDPVDLPGLVLGARDADDALGLDPLTPLENADDLWRTFGAEAAALRPSIALDSQAGDTVRLGSADLPVAAGQFQTGGASASRAVRASDGGTGMVVAPRPLLLQAAMSAAPLAPPAVAPPPSSDSSGAVQTRFDLSAINSSPFPSDRFTVADATQNTGRRVNLPLPDATTHPSDYEDVQGLNTLDGFNLQPRLSIPFDGPIDPFSVNSQNVLLMSLGSTLPHGGDPLGKVIGINQVVWDPATNTLHAESDELLAQHTRYLLLVTNGVQDAQGAPVGGSVAFRDMVGGRFDLEEPVEVLEYRGLLLSGLRLAQLLRVVPQSEVVAASLFTTQSATAVLEKIRNQIHAATPEPADFLLGPGGTRTVFPLDEVTGITWNQQTRVTGPLNPVSLDFSLFRDTIPGAVGQLAYGKYLSAEYRTDDGVIPQVGTRTGTPAVQRINEVYFNLILPSGPAPTGGWPVVVLGTGAGLNKQGFPRLIAMMNAHGIATILINHAGHGFGPLGTLTINRTTGAPVTFSAGGRGIDRNGDGTIGTTEGYSPRRPQILMLGIGREGSSQTAVDLIQLSRVIGVGMDANGDGVRDLDPSRIYFFGHSLGAEIGTQFLAVEPSVRAGVLYSVGGGLMDIVRLGTVAARPDTGRILQSRAPSLLNPPGLTSIGGLPVLAPHFNENLPLRDRPPVINDVPGAVAIQEVMDRTEWFTMPGDPLAYVPHLQRNPLPGVPVKPVLILFPHGDQSLVNPQTSAFLRAGDLASRTTFYRNDLAFAEMPTVVPRNPHSFLTNVSHPFLTEIALGAQRQVATFLASDGITVIHPEPARFFEVPIAGSLPEDFNFIL